MFVLAKIICSGSRSAGHAQAMKITRFSTTRISGIKSIHIPSSAPIINESYESYQPLSTSINHHYQPDLRTACKKSEPATKTVEPSWLSKFSKLQNSPSDPLGNPPFPAEPSPQGMTSNNFLTQYSPCFAIFRP